MKERETKTLKGTNLYLGSKMTMLPKEDVIEEGSMMSHGEIRTTTKILRIKLWLGRSTQFLGHHSQVYSTLLSIYILRHTYICVWDP
jgi:hypothetical protein